jgi:hypothetical protein
VIEECHFQSRDCGAIPNINQVFQMFQIIIGIPYPYLEDSPDFSQKSIAELVLGKSIGKENEIRVGVVFQELCCGLDELVGV